MHSGASYLLILWPLLPLSLGWHFHRRQNGKDAWTGGPISWPKSLWLAYTISTWFLLPLVWIFGMEISTTLNLFFIFTLISWWIRGPLELLMIYRWYSWSPRYGILHDIFNLIVGALLLSRELSITLISGGDEPLAYAFAFVCLVGVSAEAWFAFLFLRARSQKEASENIYFASDDPKWKFINRATLTVVIFVYGHLIGQSVLMFLTLR